VSLAALIAAYHEADEPQGVLRATLPLAGRTVVERQARLAAACGADPIIILVERIPPALLAAIDRVRAEGISVAVARSAAEAAEAVDPGDRLLLMADGLVADESHIARLTGAGGPALLTLPDQGEDDRYERIDSESLWAGLALVEGSMLGRTAEMLGEWDLQSTLLRQAVQSGARQLALRGEAADDRLTIAENAGDLAEAEAVIVAGASAPSGSWISRYLLGPVEQSLTRALMASAVTPAWLYIAAATAVGLGGLLFAKGWLAAGLAILLLSTPLEGSAERLSKLRMEGRVPPDWWSYTLPLVAALTLTALGWHLAGTRGWGCMAVVAATILFMLALRLEQAGRKVAGEIWLAEPKAMTWILLPFAIGSAWTSALIALAAYAAGSFFWVQREVHRRRSPPAQD
jgi:hypothetical protein